MLLIIIYYSIDCQIHIRRVQVLFHLLLTRDQAIIVIGTAVDYHLLYQQHQQQQQLELVLVLLVIALYQKFLLPKCHLLLLTVLQVGHFIMLLLLHRIKDGAYVLVELLVRHMNARLLAEHH